MKKPPRNIRYSQQSLNLDDIDAVIDVLRSDWLTQGPSITAFEDRLVQYCSAQHAVAVSNGTAALHLACMALGVTKGDIVWTSPNSFLASANCARFCGADVDFVDIDPITRNLCVLELEKKLRLAKLNNTLPKVLIPVHFAGKSCDMRRIFELSQEFGFSIIEDACHALGGTYNGKKVGCCEYSDLAVFSFHPAKVITTGEGGAILTNKSELSEKIRCLLTHGMTRNTELMENPSHGPWYYEQIALGLNYRITDIQAALGFSQMKRLDAFVRQRQELAKRYYNKLVNLPIILPDSSDIEACAFHLFPIGVDKKIRKTVFTALRSKGIGVNVHYIPIHTQPYYQRLGFAWGNYPNAEKYYESAISLPLHPELSFEDQDFICESLEKILANVTTLSENTVADTSMS